ncbi:unnamed protein product [Rotaria sp. Silwood2]|nr:unnamed protein product [Rotaria sp. Silwood2]
MSDEIDDLSFPNEVISRLMNQALDSSTTISKQARAAIANQYPTNPKRKTVTVQHIFKPLETNQFYMLIQPLQQALKGLLGINR